MDFRIDIVCNNAAFEDSASSEVARILRILADNIEAQGADPDHTFTIQDLNGNRVGHAAFSEQN